jgi:hypothetical protein
MRTQDISIVVNRNGTYSIQSGRTIYADNLEDRTAAVEARDRIVAANNACANKDFKAVGI